MELQTKFSSAVGNRRLAPRINGSLHSTNQEVNSIRLELDVTNKKLKEISIIKDVCARCQENSNFDKISEEKMLLIARNRQLQEEIANLKQQINNNENQHRETMEALKTDRDRLKLDKAELLSQIQETQKTIDDKEEQLREFIRDFNQQMKEYEDMIREADEERVQLSRDRKDLSRKHQDLVEVVATLRGELVTSERRIRELEIEIASLRQMNVSSQPVKRRSLHFSVDDSLAVNRSINVTATEPNSSMQSNDPLLVPGSPASPHGYLGPSGSGDAHSSSSTEDIRVEFVPMAEALGQSYKNRQTTLVQHLSGSLSRAWKRTRNRKSVELARPNGTLSLPRHSSFSIGCLSPDVETFLEAESINTYNWTEEEKQEILSSNADLPMQKWKADIVLIWFELVMHMSQYLKECQDNIKSGKVLLGMSDAELTRCLGISHPLHCRKLSLAIDEFRNPATTISNTSAVGKLDHWWICEQWLRDVALTQYVSRFREHLIDGRTLASLTRKDLEKFLGMEGKKLHQESVLRGVQLLSMLAYNKERLNERREMCETADTDVLVWNNNRLIQWVKSIDLKEYSPNLKDSGVHGALIVLDSNFTADDLAGALGIPVNKATLRRHLASEFDALVKQARECVGDEILNSSFDCGKKSSFSRSNSTSSRFRRSIKSSISRTIGRQLSKENQPSVK